MSEPGEAPDLRIVRSDDFTVEVVLEDQSPIGGRTWRAQIREDYDAATDIDFTIASAEGTGDEAGNVVLTLTLDRTLTLNLPESGRWDLEEVAADGEVTTILRGKVVRIDDVTRV